MTVYLPVWHSHCTRPRFTVTMSCSDEIAVHSCPLLCAQREVVKHASGLFYFWSLYVTTIWQPIFKVHFMLLVVGVLPHVTVECRHLGRWCSESVTAGSGKPRIFILCEKKQAWICSNASTSLKKPLLVWAMCLSVTVRGGSRRGDWVGRPPTTYESNFIHYNFV